MVEEIALTLVLALGSIVPNSLEVTGKEQAKA